MQVPIRKSLSEPSGVHGEASKCNAIRRARVKSGQEVALEGTEGVSD
jgi:hypothetical protein